MQSSKLIAETPPNSKSRPATPKGSQLQRAARSAKPESNSPSTLQKSKPSIERSPKTVSSKSANGLQVSKINTHDKQQRGTTKGASEVQSRLNTVQEELKKMIEHLASVENEKARALGELKNANEKLEEALAAKQKAEERIDIRPDATERKDIEYAQKKEEDLRKEQSLDAKALASAMEEIEGLKNELSMAVDVKNTAINHANDAKKAAEANSAKAERVSAEVYRLRNLLNSRKEITTDNYSAEVDYLKRELDRSKSVDRKVAQMEEMIEDLKIEISSAKTAESEACAKFDEMKKKAEFLEVHVDEANRARRSSSETLASAMKEMEESNTLLLQSQAEVHVLKQKLESLMAELARKNSDLDESNSRRVILQSELRTLEETNNSDLKESNRRVEIAKREMEFLKSEIKFLEEAKMQALKNEKSAMQENNKLVVELESTNGETEKLREAMEDLSSAMHEISCDARDTREMLFMKQAEFEEARTEIEELKFALKNTKENYEVMLDEAKYEIVCLKKAAERLEDANEGNFAEMTKKMDENADLEESGESLKLQERLLEKEDELRSTTRENDELRMRVKELTSLLEEVKSKNVVQNGNGNITDDDDGADENEHQKSLSEILGDVIEQHHREGSDVNIANGNGNVVDEELAEGEPEAGSMDEELDAKKESGSFEKMNELRSGTVENEQKKKKGLFKFGVLLKKKSNIPVRP